MAAQLNSGIRSLHLNIPVPTDSSRQNDIRDDLVAVKVWYSEVTPFDPLALTGARGTLFSEGNSLSVTITGLETNKRYYVKYALISAIQPEVFTVSRQYSAMTFDENTSLYGYLTNDPTGLSTDSFGNGGNWSVTQGVFKLFSFSEDVTGKNDPTDGPEYLIKPNSIIGGLVPFINRTTGAYYATSMTENSGSVIYTAKYKGMTVEKVWNVYKGPAGQTAPTIQLTATSKEFVYKDVNQKRSQTAGTTITATLKNLVGTPAFETRAFSREGVELGAQFGTYQIAFTQSGNSITITDAQFSQPLDNNVDIGYVLVTARVGEVFDSISIYRVNDGSDQIQVQLSNQTHTITAAEDGGTDPLNYVGSGTTITVKKGVRTLLVDKEVPYPADTWRVIGTNPQGIVIDDTPSANNGASFVEYDRHSNMTADVAYIDYTVRVQITEATSSNPNGTFQDFVVRQSFSKSKQGVRGNTARNVNLTYDKLAFITPQNSSVPTPEYITFTATASNYTNRAQYTWKVDGIDPTAQIGTVTQTNGNVFRLNKFAAGESKLVRVTIAEDGFSNFDEQSIVSLKEGSDAVTVTIQNSSRNIVCDSLGVPEANQLPFTTTFFVAQGINILNNTNAVTFAPVSYTGGGSNQFSIGERSGIISIESLNSPFAEAKFTATVGSLVIPKSIFLTKVKDGKTPVKGVDYNDGTSLKVQYSQNAADWHDAYIVGDVFIRIGTVSPNGSIVYSAAQKYIPEKGQEYDDGIDGKSSYLHIKYSDNGGASFTTGGLGNGEAPGDWIGTYTDESPLDSNDVTKYTWVRIKGEEGKKGPRNASGFLYHQVSRTSPPGPPSLVVSSWNWATGTFGNPGADWSHSLFTPAAGEKAYAVRYYVSESEYGVTPVNVELGAVTTSITFDGLVTFTDLSSKVSNGRAASDINDNLNEYNPVTQILGGAIRTGTIDANKLTIGDHNNNSGGNRIVISSNTNNIQVYSNGVVRVKIGNLA